MSPRSVSTDHPEVRTYLQESCELARGIAIPWSQPKQGRQAQPAEETATKTVDVGQGNERLNKSRLRNWLSCRLAQLGTLRFGFGVAVPPSTQTHLSQQLKYCYQIS